MTFMKRQSSAIYQISTKKTDAQMGLQRVQTETTTLAPRAVIRVKVDESSARKVREDFLRPNEVPSAGRLVHSEYSEWSDPIHVKCPEHAYCDAQGTRF